MAAPLRAARRLSGSEPGLLLLQQGAVKWSLQSLPPRRSRFTESVAELSGRGVKLSPGVLPLHHEAPMRLEWS